MQIYASPRAEHTMNEHDERERAQKKKRLLTRWLKRGMREEKVMNVQMQEVEGVKVEGETLTTGS